MSIKSHIDWNELFPLLPRATRDTLLLEAVTLLSADPTKRRKSRQAPLGEDIGPDTILSSKNAQLPKTLRTWAEKGDNRPLAAPGRHYRIVSSKPPITKGEVKAIWEGLLERKTDYVAYETVLKTLKGDRVKTSNHINYLWRTGRLEVQPPML
jgi:hypothetical protein